MLKKCSLLQTLRARARTRKPRPTSLRANKRSQKEAKKAAAMAMKLNNGDISIHNNQVKEVGFFAVETRMNAFMRCTCYFLKKANIAERHGKILGQEKRPSTL